ncbi:MAG: site-specific integrase [Candidatus Acidiferrum sp.]
MSRRSGQSGSVYVKGSQYIGRYRADVPGQNKRVRRTVIIGNIDQFTRPKAERWLSKFIEEEGINDASHLARSQSPVVTFGVAARGWRDHHLIVNKKRSSQRSMSCELNKHILPHLKDTPLEEITYPLVRSLIQTWQREDLSRKSIKNLFGIVRAIYNFQFDEMAQCGKPIVSPWLVKWKKVAPPKTVQRELPYFTVAQMAAVVNAAKTQSNRALFALAAGTGARAGELFALRVEADVNLNEQTITIRRSVFEGEENTSKSDTGDKDRTRTVPIDPSVATELKKHLKGRRSGYLFETRNGTPLRLSNVLEDKLQPILKKLRLVQPGMGMHAFRRGRISHLVYSGVSRQVIRDWCGHSSDKMIDHYTKMLRQHHAPEMAKVKPLLGRSWTPVGPQLVEGRVAR